jgi:hypothetical protein
MRQRRAVWIWAAFLFVIGSGACYHKDDYTLTEPHVAAIISLQSVSGATTIPADGVTRLALVAKISPNADPDKRDIVFTASAGTLIGGTMGASAAEHVVSAAGNGEAPIELQSTTQVQPSVVTAKVKNVNGIVADLTVQFVAVTGNDVIRFVNVPSGPVPADGATLTPLTVAVSPQLVGQKVTFTSSSGTFVDSPASVAVDDTATAHLMSPSAIGSADVTATITGFTRTTSVQFSRALPNAVTITMVSPDVIPAKDGSMATVTAQMSRDVGQVSPGTIATFSAVANDSSGAVVGFFSRAQAPSDAGGAVVTQYFPTAAAKPGTVKITVTAPGAGGSTVSGFIIVEITSGG